MQLEMKVSAGYFSQWRAGRNPPMGKLCEALEHLGVDTATFFHDAFSDKEPQGSTEVGDYVLRCLDEAENRA